MKDFEKWQIVSFISRFGAQIIGIFQVFLVALILTPFEYGLYSISNGLSKTFGSYQNLGLQSSSTREIAAAKDLKEAFKIFLVSASFRYLVSIPLAVLLFIFSDYFANVQYLEPRIEMALKVYAGIILLQAIQGIFNTVLSGLKKFKIIFSYQVAIALISFLVTVPAVYFLEFEGTYISYLIVTLISVLVLGYFALKSFEGNFTKINRHEYFVILKEIFSLSVAVYIVKVILSNWENFGKIILSASITMVLLGDKASTELVGVFAVALAYSTKIMMISDSVTDINMTIFTEKFINSIPEFAKDFISNFSKIFIATTFVSITAIFWGKEVFTIAFGDKFSGVELFIPFLVLAYWAYSFINIIKSSVYVPAKRLLVLVLNFVFLLVSSAAIFYLLTIFFEIGVSMAVSVAMAVGAILTLAIFFMDLYLKYKILLLDKKILIYFALSLPVLLAFFYFDLEFIKKIVMYIFYSGSSLFLMYKWGVLKGLKQK